MTTAGCATKLASIQSLYGNLGEHRDHSWNLKLVI